MAAAGTARFIIRPATASDMADVQAVVTRAGLSSGQPAALEYCRTGPGGRLVVACQHDRVTGVAYSVSFGPTGWIGNVAVDPGARGRGLGTAVSEAALGWLLQAGVTTVLLTATDLGRPVYERLGFTDDGVCYGIWERDRWPVPAADGAPGIRPGRIADAIRLDAEATGEDRGSYLSTFAARVRAPGGRAGTGYRIPLPWGKGPVVASRPDSARALVTDMLRANPAQSLTFPESNAAATELAASLGFRPTRRCTRMRLGPAVRGFRPERIFNAFSLAVG